MALEIVFAIIGISVAGLAAVVGIWVERDPRRPPRWAWALSILILLATAVTVFQSYLEVAQGDRMEEDMARMLQQLDKLAASSEDPNLQAFVTSELNAQARANPDIVEKLADRVEDDGGDAADMLSKHMSASEVANLAETGKIKKKKASKPKPAEEQQPAKKTATASERGDRDTPTPEEKTATSAPAGDARGGRGGDEPEEAAEETPTETATTDDVRGGLSTKAGIRPTGDAEEEAPSKTASSGSVGTSSGLSKTSTTGTTKKSKSGVSKKSKKKSSSSKGR